MAALRSGSFTRTLMSTARSSFRSSPPLTRLRPPPLAPPPRFQAPRRTFTNPRTFGELGCTQSLLPLHSMVSSLRLTSHLAVSARACCELSQGTFCRSCQDR